MGSRPPVVPFFGRYEQLELRYDPEQRAVWCYMNPKPRPCFNPGILEDLKHCWATVGQIDRRHLDQEEGLPIRYVIWASATPAIYNLGGDLDLFLQYAASRDRDGLERYAKACIDAVHVNSVAAGIPGLTSICLVQGDALGGGFEAALSSHVLVAEEGARFGLPEILFNLIPGMGAYSFLSSKLDRARAERLILSGNLHTAAELETLGVVDVLAKDGEGEQAVCEYIRRHSRRHNAHCALARARARLGEVSYDELRDITGIWVDAVLQLEEKDLRIMRRLVAAQNRRAVGEEAASPFVMEAGTSLRN